MSTFRVTLAQINTTVGDLDGNSRKIAEFIARARDEGAAVVVFPELTITGYPPEDLLIRRQFIADNVKALSQVAGSCRGISAIVGYVEPDGDAIYNAAAIVRDGELVATYRKQRLPNYGVFDEMRYFSQGDASLVYHISGVPVGVNVCEDIWFPGDPTESQARSGARVILNINGSPYHAGKRHFREEMLAGRAGDYGVAICYTNQVGGQDELVFDGGSMVIAPDGALLARAKMFDEDLLVCDIPIDGAPATAGRIEPELTLEAEVYQALVTATRDYIRKTGFSRALIALSGGIDSALVAAIAADALGPDNVVGVGLPSRYSSEGSVRDSQALAANLGIRFVLIPIEPAHASYLDMLERPFRELDSASPGVAEENVQARIRGNVIMALSNKLGWIVLTTGNKSEFATGYATLYGDMSGGYAVIKDVPKTLVYRLARHRNELAGRDIIPESIITKPPSAELKPGQLDQDTLPPYDLLDRIIEEYVEKDRSVQEIAALGLDEDTVRRVVQMINRNEYKRRQAPPGVKITPRAFGRDRRLPLASKYRGY
jgi:NAD+ synthase (glutamine-hydrolysing)